MKKKNLSFSSWNFNCLFFILSFDKGSIFSIFSRTLCLCKNLSFFLSEIILFEISFDNFDI